VIVMSRDLDAVIGFVKTVDSISSLELLSSAAAQVLSPYGVSSLSANLISAPRRVVKPGILFGERWGDWSAHYGRNSLHRADPAVRMLARRHRPYSWTEARTIFPSSMGERVMDACRDYTGFREGLVIPIYESDGSLLTALLCGRELDLSPEVRPFIHLAGYHYAARGRELSQGIGHNPVCPLTRRQVECLQWVKDGKTDRQIGILMGISTATVHNHIEAAKRILGTPKRTLAALEAWRQGWLI
jgi:LuxR family quorum sensing-dependent transcriptional regulator